MSKDKGPERESKRYNCWQYLWLMYIQHFCEDLFYETTFKSGYKHGFVQT